MLRRCSSESRWAQLVRICLSFVLLLLVLPMRSWSETVRQQSESLSESVQIESLLKQVRVLRQQLIAMQQTSLLSDQAREESSKLREQMSKQLSRLYAQLQLWWEHSQELTKLLDEKANLLSKAESSSQAQSEAQELLKLAFSNYKLVVEPQIQKLENSVHAWRAITLGATVIAVIALIVAVAPSASFTLRDVLNGTR